MTMNEQTVANSFQLAKNDIYALYEHVKVLHEQLADMKAHKCTCTTKKPAKRLVGSKTGSKIHETTCLFAKKIKSANMIEFTSRKQATSKGYKPCSCVLT
jgi:hypothetical protein